MNKYKVTETESYRWAGVDKTYIVEANSEEEAIEFFDYNVAGGYIGKYQPLIIDDTGV